ncbi:MAG: hypothetical protein ACRDXD_13390 [Acidimicrobiia bacterium]
MARRRATGRGKAKTAGTKAAAAETQEQSEAEQQADDSQTGDQEASQSTQILQGQPRSIRDAAMRVGVAATGIEEPEETEQEDGGDQGSPAQQVAEQAAEDFTEDELDAKDLAHDLLLGGAYIPTKAAAMAVADLAENAEEIADQAEEMAEDAAQDFTEDEMDVKDLGYDLFLGGAYIPTKAAAMAADEVAEAGEDFAG